MRDSVWKSFLELSNSPNVDRRIYSRVKSYVRQRWRKGKLTEEQINVLKKMNIYQNPHEEKWMANYNELEAYISKYKTNILPYRAKAKQLEGGKYYSLNIWLMNQRRHVKKLSRNRLTLLSKLDYEFAKEELKKRG